MENSRTAHRWIFTEDQLRNSPSRKKMSAATESDYRRQAAYLIRDVAQQLNLGQLVISTAIVYMNRFYMCHSFKAVSRNVGIMKSTLYALFNEANFQDIAIAALFLSAKIEECPQRLEHVIRARHMLVHPGTPQPDVKSYNSLAENIVNHELILLQTLGFEFMVEHPHKYIVQCAQHVPAIIELSEMAYSIATYSLLVTNFCLKYKPTEVAAMCIRLACKWMSRGVPLTSDEKPFWETLDSAISGALVDCMVSEILRILQRYPKMLQKLNNFAGNITPKDTTNRLEPCAAKGADQGPTSDRSKRNPRAAETNSPVTKQSPDAIATIGSNTRIDKSQTTVAQYHQRTKMAQWEKRWNDEFAGVPKSQSTVPAVRKKADHLTVNHTEAADSRHRMKSAPVQSRSAISAVQKKADLRVEHNTNAATSQNRMETAPVQLQSTIPADQKNTDLRFEHNKKAAASQHRMETDSGQSQSTIPAVQKKADAPTVNHTKAAESRYRMKSAPVQLQSTIPAVQKIADLRVEHHTKAASSQHRVKTAPVQNGVLPASHSYKEQIRMSSSLEKSSSNATKEARRPGVNLASTSKKQKSPKSYSVKRHREPDEERHQTDHVNGWRNPAAEVTDKVKKARHEVARPSASNPVSTKPPSAKKRKIYDLSELSESEVQELCQLIRSYLGTTISPEASIECLGRYFFDMTTPRQVKVKVKGMMSKALSTNGHVTAPAVQAPGPTKLTDQRNGFHDETSSSQHSAKVTKEKRRTQMPTERRAKVKASGLSGKVMPSNEHIDVPFTQVSVPKSFNGDALSRKYGFDPTKPVPLLPPDDIFDSDD